MKRKLVLGVCALFSMVAGPTAWGKVIPIVNGGLEVPVGTTNPCWIPGWSNEVGPFYFVTDMKTEGNNSMYGFAFDGGVCQLVPGAGHPNTWYKLSIDFLVGNEETGLVGNGAGDCGYQLVILGLGANPFDTNTGRVYPFGQYPNGWHTFSLSHKTSLYVTDYQDILIYVRGGNVEGMASIIDNVRFESFDEPTLNKTFTVPAIAEITVDGDLNDWSASSDWSTDYVLWSGDALFSTTNAKFAYNAATDMLYVAIRTNQTNGGHAVVGISSNIDATALSTVGDFGTQLAFDAVPDGQGGLTAVVMNEITEYTKNPDVPGDQGYNHKTTDVVAAVKLGTDGYYTYEVAIPAWTNWVTPQTRADLAEGEKLWVYSMMQDAFGTANGMDMTFDGNPGFAGAHGFSYAAELTLAAGTTTPTPTPTPTPIPGDANSDGYVNVSDLGILATHYGTTAGATWAMGDFTGDGNVNVSDLGILATYYGTGTGSALDFNADAKALNLPVDAKGDTPVTSTLGCGSAGLPLLAGLLLAGLLANGLNLNLRKNG